MNSHRQLRLGCAMTLLTGYLHSFVLESNAVGDYFLFLSRLALHGVQSLPASTRADFFPPRGDVSIT